MTRTVTRTALITGAGSGIGFEAARLLARDGVAVVLVGRRQEALDKAEAAIRAEGGTAHAIAADITRPDDVTRLVDRIHDRLGPVDVLVNNAGSASSVLNPQWLPHEEWRQVLDVNLTAVFQLTQAVLPDMLGRGGGTIVTVSSLAAVNPNLLGGAAYGAAKAGVRNFMTFLHNTFRNEGLRAITVLPGETDTPILDNRARPPATEERAHMLRPEDVAEAIRLAVTLPQRVVLQEIVVAPTRQRDTSADLDISRRTGAPADAPATRVGSVGTASPTDTSTHVHPSGTAAEADTAHITGQVHHAHITGQVHHADTAGQVQPTDTAAHARPADTKAQVQPADPTAQVQPADTASEIRPGDTAPEIRPTGTGRRERPTDATPQPHPTGTTPQARPAEPEHQVRPTDPTPQPHPTDARPQD
ncbi:NADP-dependent 3-hydroxy acid dehydrogenase YdfG [Streptomyces sp. cf386]|uniref:SDR family NAD(P)-dependent oxidoreductase n=1 Tax=Streptomyces sp. cf386 TaxID=1761904 RepID=UPI00088CD17A|nr:SDR family NAD(P)-dependent oxidoreductase [Streptomyces sp. cf386]SDO95964.1 NADP-dependent 3-hydroxy acid dehydrogenase YdfG [Streptomyces sp. cf386]